MPKLSPERVQIPLSMLPGNLEVLLDGPLYVQTIQLKRDPATANGVIMMIAFTDSQREAAADRGFKTTPSND
jgi:hypothetical protein